MTEDKIKELSIQIDLGIEKNRTKVFLREHKGKNMKVLEGDEKTVALAVWLTKNLSCRFIDMPKYLYCMKNSMEYLNIYCKDKIFSEQYFLIDLAWQEAKQICQISDEKNKKLLDSLYKLACEDYELNAL